METSPKKPNPKPKNKNPPPKTKQVTSIKFGNVVTWGINIKERFKQQILLYGYIYIVENSVSYHNKICRTS